MNFKTSEMQEVEYNKSMTGDPINRIPVESSYVATSSKEIVSGEGTPRSMTHRRSFNCLRFIGEALLQPCSHWFVVNEISEC